MNKSWGRRAGLSRRAKTGHNPWVRQSGVLTSLWWAGKEEADPGHPLPGLLQILWAESGDLLPYPKILVSLSPAEHKEEANWDGWVEGGGRGPNSSEGARHSPPSKNRGLYKLSLRKEIENREFPTIPSY